MTYDRAGAPAWARRWQLFTVAHNMITNERGNAPVRKADSPITTNGPRHRSPPISASPRVP